MGKIAGVALLSLGLVGGTVTADTTRPAALGKSVTLVAKKTVTLGGVSISFASANHKHARGGDTLGMWTFVAKKGGASEPIELRSKDAHFQAEVAVHGVAFVFEHLEYEKFTLTLAAQKAPDPLDDDACAERVLALAAKRGLKEGASRGYANHQGIVTVTSGTWRGYCGTLTKRVWIVNEAK